MEVPWNCGCGEENWIDLERLDEWPLDRLVSAMGFTCRKCGMREAISYSTPSLKEAERNLILYRPSHRKFKYKFLKLVRKQSGVNARGEAYGTSEHPNVAVP